MFKKTVMAGFVAAALGSGLTPALAADPTPEHTVTGNVGLFSQYVFRGLKQTNGKPALQGGFDYSHSSGFYAGTWASNVSVLADGAPPAYMDGGSLEWDFYGGYKWGFANDFTLDLGTLYYYYPGSANTTATKGGGPLNPKADTWEIYAGLSWKFLSAKYSYSVDNKTFALADSKGTYYLDLSANYPVGDSGFTLVAHYGIQKYSGTDPRLLGTGLNNDAIASYEDWKLGVNYTLPKDFTIGVFYTDTSGANSLYYGSPGDTPAGTYPKNIAKGTGTIFISKTF